MRALVIIGLLGCGHSDPSEAPARTHARDDAPRLLKVAPHEPIDAKPLVIENVERGEPPASMVVVTSEPKFYIDRTEVTAGAYRECVEANACEPPSLGEWKT